MNFKQMSKNIWIISRNIFFLTSKCLNRLPKTNLTPFTSKRFVQIQSRKMFIKKIIIFNKIVQTYVPNRLFSHLLADRGNTRLTILVFPTPILIIHTIQCGMCKRVCCILLNCFLYIYTYLDFWMSRVKTFLVPFGAPYRSGHTL